MKTREELQAILEQQQARIDALEQKKTFLEYRVEDLEQVRDQLLADNYRKAEHIQRLRAQVDHYAQAAFKPVPPPTRDQQRAERGIRYDQNQAIHGQALQQLKESLQTARIQKIDRQGEISYGRVFFEQAPYQAPQEAGHRPLPEQEAQEIMARYRDRERPGENLDSLYHGISREDDPR